MNDRPYLIGLVGPSCSGKSTLAKRFLREVPEGEVIKQDKFYKDVITFPMTGGWRNQELPENVYWDKLCWVLSELKAGREVAVPEYSKLVGRQTGTRMAWPAPVVLVEGFLLLWDERVRDLLDMVVYLEVSPDVQLHRRLEREPDVDMEYLRHVVVPVYERYGRPMRGLADVVLDGEQPPQVVWRNFWNRVVVSAAK